MPGLGEAEGRRGRPGEPVTCGLALRKCEPDGFRNTGPGSVAARLRRTALIAWPLRTAFLNTTRVRALQTATANDYEPASPVASMTSAKVVSRRTPSIRPCTCSQVARNGQAADLSHMSKPMMQRLTAKGPWTAVAASRRVMSSTARLRRKPPPGPRRLTTKSDCLRDCMILRMKSGLVPATSANSSAVKDVSSGKPAMWRRARKA